VLEEAIRQLRVGILEDGTAIGHGDRDQRQLGCVARRARAKSWCCSPTARTTRARSIRVRRRRRPPTFGIRIYTIGVGDAGRGAGPHRPGPLGLRYETMPVKIDEQLARRGRPHHGGRYFRRETDAASLSNFSPRSTGSRRSGATSRVSALRQAVSGAARIGLLALALELVWPLH